MGGRWSSPPPPLEGEGRGEGGRSVRALTTSLSEVYWPSFVLAGRIRDNTSGSQTDLMQKPTSGRSLTVSRS